MVHRAAAAAPVLHEQSAIPGLTRHDFARVTIVSWVIVFDMAALTAAWFGGAWTPANKPIPGASWFSAGPHHPGAWRA
ncbi:MAG TPA: hypothetical protein VK801_15090 [Caulobacteraceae bacterium]|nr:hypothetical protein [Caulobacteraceae bacterium]